MNELLTAKEAAQLLKIFRRDGTPNPAGATKFLTDHGIVPINFGRGAGRGLRFFSTEIKDLIESLRPKTKPQARPKKLRRKPSNIFNGSYKDLQGKDHSKLQ